MSQFVPPDESELICPMIYFWTLIDMDDKASDDRVTIIRDTTPPLATHEEGWLTFEAYLAWVSTQAEVFLGDSPLQQAEPFPQAKKVAA